MSFIWVAADINTKALLVCSAFCSAFSIYGLVVTANEFNFLLLGAMQMHEYLMNPLVCLRSSPCCKQAC